MVDDDAVRAVYRDAPIERLVGVGLAEAGVRAVYVARALRQLRAVLEGDHVGIGGPEGRAVILDYRAPDRLAQARHGRHSARAVERYRERRVGRRSWRRAAVAA